MHRFTNWIYVGLFYKLNLAMSRLGYHNRTIAFFDQYELCRELSADDLFSDESSDYYKSRSQLPLLSSDQSQMIKVEGFNIVYEGAMFLNIDSLGVILISDSSRLTYQLNNKLEIKIIKFFYKY